MSAEIYWARDLPEKVEGTAVVADIWAATTNMVWLVGSGVEKLVVANQDNLEQLKRRYPQALVFGESLTLPSETFDASNFPHDISRFDVSGKTILYMSTNGSAVVELAIKKGAGEVLTASFLNLQTTANYLKKKSSQFYFVAAGRLDRPDDEDAREDWLFMETLRTAVFGEEINWSKQLSEVKTIVSNYRSLDFESDFRIVLDLNRYNILVTCQKSTEGIIVKEK